jgi:sugar lactone lactonase YvrE
MFTQNLSFVLRAFVLLAVATLIGCGVSTINPVTVPGTPVLPAQAAGGVSGVVHGGSQVIGSSHVYLYAVAATGYGQPAISLLGTGSNVQLDANGSGYVQTDTNGKFSLTGDYNCPSTTSLVYLLAVGGNPGLKAGTNNASISLMTALGNCSAIKANAATTVVTLNELTTVAAAYALSGFAASATQIGSSATNLNGITNAFTTAGLLASTATGVSFTTTPSGNGIVPQVELNTLADILAACVNSDGTTLCPQLFAATTVNGVAPTDTFQAILNAAHTPALQVAPLMKLVPAQAPFLPTLSTAPNDWTVAISFAGNGLATPQAVAIDAGGNAWVANASNTITELSAGTGTPVSGVGGFSASGLDAPVSLAIDTTGNVWIANCGNPCSGSGNPSSVTVLAPGGTTSSNYTSVAFNGAYALAISGLNEPWVANSLGSSLTKLNSAGGTTIPATVAAGLIYPISVSITPSGKALTVSPANNAVVGFNADGSVDQTDSYQGASLSYPSALAQDHSGNIWVANHGNNTVTVLSSGAAIRNSPYSGGGITTPTAIALDGDGTAWITNTSGTLSGIANVGTVLSPSTGLRNDLVFPDAIAVDASGNIWVASCGHYCQPSNQSTGSVSLLVGAAAPVTTPLSVAASSNALAMRP